MLQPWPKPAFANTGNTSTVTSRGSGIASLERVVTRTMRESSPAVDSVVTSARAAK
jgi:hypothetical protein